MLHLTVGTCCTLQHCASLFHKPFFARAQSSIARVLRSDTMFLPRVIRNKGFREPEKVRRKQPSEEPSEERPTKRPRIEDDLDKPLGASEKRIAATNKPQLPSKTSPATESQDTIKPQNDVKPRGPRFTVAPITDEYLEKLVCGIELIFSDYAHLDPENIPWLRSHYRTVNGETGYIHLSAFLTHDDITSLKPPATQPLLARALTKFPSEYLETNIAHNTITHVRRNPQTFPLAFIPQTPTDLDTATTSLFWTQRTIYVEPHQRGLCNIPAAVAWYIKKQGSMRKKWLPVQAVNRVEKGRGACAFVVLSGVVEIPDIWEKWMKEQHLKDWIVMTRAEHSRREAEYLELLTTEKSKRRAPVVFGRHDEVGVQGGDAEVESNEVIKDEEKEKPVETVSAAKKKPRKRQKKKKKPEKLDTSDADGGE